MLACQASQPDESAANDGGNPAPPPSSTGGASSGGSTDAGSPPDQRSPDGSGPDSELGSPDSSSPTSDSSSPSSNAGTRDPSRYPGADGRLWSLPLQKTASWITSGPEWTLLQKGTPVVRQDGFYSVNWVVGGAGDPDCTITDGTQSFTIKVPAGTLAENAGDLGDDSLGGTDGTRPYLGWSCNGTLIDGSASNAVQPGGSTITCSIGLLIFDTTGPVMEDSTTGNGAYQSSDNAIGNLPDYELAQAVADPTYVPPHTASEGSPGSQTSATTAKGMIGGVRADAFPAPPTLQLIPSATHPEWYSTGLGNFFSSP